MFTPDDVRELQRRGISVEEGQRQIELLSGPAHYLELLRPCTVGDGIVRLDEDEAAELHALHAEAARSGRFVKFVPASGAATRMFKSLLYFRKGAGAGTTWETAEGLARSGNGDAAELGRVGEEIRHFAFYDDLKQHLQGEGQNLDALASAGTYEPIVDALLEPGGLGYADLPKGLIKFHGYAGDARTAFEEHLVEGGQCAQDANGVCRLHFTVSRDHRRAFEEVARRAEERRIAGDARFEIGFSRQKPSTDTLSLDAEGRPRRDERGRLTFRPGGHGALIENLEELEADLVFVKNIDNIQPDRAKDVGSHWKRALAGYLVRLQSEVFRYLDGLNGSAPSAELVEQARSFAREHLKLDLESESATNHALISNLNRPLRVCGVVPNTGEPGGGPFWVRDRQGRVSLQIVETGHVDARDKSQQVILRSSTHFNPVDLVCALRDREGRPFDLTRFIDPETVLVTSKSEGGHQVRALERPGLWNGAMAHWITVFVELPIESFTPVKTVIDLLRPEHQA
jgi:hypothetical protein